MPHAANCPCPACRYRRGEGAGQAPRISVRVTPDVRARILSQTEGARAYLERLVREDLERSEAPAPDQLAPAGSEGDLLWQARSRLSIYEHALTRIAAGTIEPDLVPVLARSALQEADCIQVVQPETTAKARRKSRAIPDVVKKAAHVPPLKHELEVRENGRLAHHEVPTALRALALQQHGFSPAEIARVLQHEKLPNQRQVVYWTEGLVSDLLGRSVWGVAPDSAPTHKMALPVKGGPTGRPAREKGRKGPSRGPKRKP